MKKFIATLMIMSLLGTTGVSTFANDTDTTSNLKNGLYWVLDKITKNYSQKADGSYKLFYSGAPATRTGEYDTVGYSITHSHSLSASFSTGIIKDKVEASLGIQISKSKSISWSGSKNSATLKKGEYVKAYYQKQYNVHKVIEARVTGTPNKKPTSSSPRRTVYVYQSIMPKIKLTYHKAKNLENSKSNVDTPFKTEYYEYKNGEYVLINTIYN